MEGVAHHNLKAIWETGIDKWNRLGAVGVLSQLKGEHATGAAGEPKQRTVSCVEADLTNSVDLLVERQFLQCPDLFEEIEALCLLQGAV